MLTKQSFLPLSAFFALSLAFSLSWAKSPQTNTKLGTNALANKSANSGNTAVGFDALHLDAGGANNTAVGSGALAAHVTGNTNTAVGLDALHDNTGSDDSTAVGASALIQSTGERNTAVGSLALLTNESGTENTAIGFFADVSAANLTRATAIGARAIATESNSIMLGTDTDTVIAANTMRVTFIPPLPSAAQVCFDAPGNLLQCGASSLRWKTNVRPFTPGLDVITALKPIAFDWKKDGRADIGLGAEDVAEVASFLTFSDKQGEIEGVRYEKIPLLLINAIKEQQQAIEKQREQNAALATRIERLEALLRERTAAAEAR